MEQDIVEKTKKFVEKELSGETTGHDFWHSILVWRNAVHIGKTENVDMSIVELAALLHDIGDWKLHSGESSGEQKIKSWLEMNNVDNDKILHILHIIENLAYKGPKADIIKLSNEGKVVQDADRLEGMGAIGIARTFATGQKLGQEIYNPNIKPNINQDAKEYKKQYTGEKKNTTINHFDEKLLFLKDRMNTQSGKKIAEHRHNFMKQFLDEFYKEWEGKQ
nr:phosphohydrolase [Nanoarchaeum sp.]